MPNFKTQGKINIQPLDELSFSFEITVCSSASSNDGFIPYGVNVSSVTAVVKNYDTGTDITSQIVYGATTVTNNIVTISLKWPTTDGEGRKKITFKLTLDNGAVKEADFNRLYCSDK